MAGKTTNEYKIGPFKYDEAIDCIQNFAVALTNLGLHHRFTISPTPHHLTDHQDLGEGRKNTYFQVILIDKRPGEPKPQGLTSLKIKAAERAGYAEPKTRVYEAFGQTMDLNQWAKATGVSRAALKSRIDAGMSMEEAVTQIAMKKFRKNA